MQWLRIWVKETVFGSTFEELNAEERGIWFSLLVLAGLEPPYGSICVCPGIGYTHEQLTAMLKVKDSVLRNALKKLAHPSIKKIKIEPKCVIVILNWRKYQTEYERQKPYRLKGLRRTLQGSVTGSSHGSTLQTDTDTDTEVIDIDIDTEFLKVWSRYPRKVSRKRAYSHFKSSVKNKKAVEKIHLALDNYLKSERVARGYTQDAKTWFNNWEDWVSYREDAKGCSKCDGTGFRTSASGYKVYCFCELGKEKRKAAR